MSRKSKTEGFISKNNILPGWKFVGIDDDTGLAKFVDEDGVIHELYLANLKFEEIRDKELAERLRKEYERRTSRKLDFRGEYLSIKQVHFIELEKAEVKNKKSKKVNKLTVGDRKYLMSLFVYANFENKDDKKGKKGRIPLIKEGQSLTKEMIHDIWVADWEISSEETTKKRIQKLESFQVLLKERNPNDKRQHLYYLNKKFFQKGSHSKDEAFVKIFQNKLKEIISEVKRLKKKNDGKVTRIINEGTSEERREVRRANYDDVIGFLQAVIPYFHFETYYLVKNFDTPITERGESVEDAILRHQKEGNKILEHLPLTYMGKISNISNTEVVKDYIKILHDAGAFMSMETKGKRMVRVHPYLVYSKDNDGQDSFTKAIVGMFGEH